MKSIINKNKRKSRKLKRIQPPSSQKSNEKTKEQNKYEKYLRN